MIPFPDENNLALHLEELRTRLILCLVSIAVLTLSSFFLSDILFALVVHPIKGSIPTLYFTTPYEAFMIKLKISLAGGFILGLPVIFAQLWLFVSPGLYQTEQHIALPMIFISVLLFVLGVFFAYFLVLPFALKFFLGFQSPGLEPLISVGSYVSFFLSLVLIFGFMFDLPVLLVGLIYFGAFGTSFLSRQRKMAVLLIFILAAVVTPTVDIFTQCVLAFSLWGLFELSLLAGRVIEKRRKPII